MRRIFDHAASAIKGREYRLDPRISLSVVLMLAVRRLGAAIRAVITLRKVRPICFIGKHVTLRNKQHLNLGGGVTLQDYVMIDALAANGVVISKNVNVGRYTLIQATGIMTNLGTGVVIGADSGIGAYSFIGAGGGVAIGSNVIMGQYVSFHSENHYYSDEHTIIREQGVRREGIEIGDNCWIGAKVTVLDGTRVGSGCVIAAGAVVKGIFSDNLIIGGVPAKVIGSRLKPIVASNAP